MTLISPQYLGDQIFRSYASVRSGIISLFSATKGLKYRAQVEKIRDFMLNLENEKDAGQLAKLLAKS